MSQSDVATFETIYDAHHRLVYGIGIRLLGNRHDAEDLTQAVFLKFWRSPESFTGGSFRAWLSRVARNHAVDMLRFRDTHPTSELTGDVALVASLEDLVAARMDGERVRAALRVLPDAQRELVELGFFQGLTHEELSRSTGIPFGTVKTRIRSGLQTLRGVLSRPLPEAAG